MILDIEGTEVDTEEDHAQHKKNIRKSILCARDEPRQFFTVSSPLPNARERYVNLVYNEDGKELLKVYYWDSLILPKKLEKVKKDRECYFTRQNEEDWETREVPDYNFPRYSEHITVWERDNPKYNRTNPTNYAYYPEHKKSRWKFW